MFKKYIYIYSYFCVWSFMYMITFQTPENANLYNGYLSAVVFVTLYHYHLHADYTNVKQVTSFACVLHVQSISMNRFLTTVCHNGIS